MLKATSRPDRRPGNGEPPMSSVGKANRWQDGFNEGSRQADQRYGQRVVEQSARIERLRAALEKIADATVCECGPCIARRELVRDTKISTGDL